MLIDSVLIDELLAKAEACERKRINFDLRNSADDQSQRMLNALLPGTVLPIHRHRDTAETVVVIRGCMTEIFYDDNGTEVARQLLSPSSGNYGLQIPAGQWHTIIVHEPTVIIECKDGPYTPIVAEDILPND